MAVSILGDRAGSDAGRPRRWRPRPCCPAGRGRQIAGARRRGSGRFADRNADGARTAGRGRGIGADGNRDRLSGRTAARRSDRVAAPRTRCEPSALAVAEVASAAENMPARAGPAHRKRLVARWRPAPCRSAKGGVWATTSATEPYAIAISVNRGPLARRNHGSKRMLHQKALSMRCRQMTTRGSPAASWQRLGEVS